MSKTDFKINTEALIEAYKKGESLNLIAKRFDTYPTTVKRILEKNHILLRHDTNKKGMLTVRDGEKLIEWAKVQGRLVTKAELAKVLGKKRLSPSYFIKYPELGQYMVSKNQKDIQKYAQKLYEWLNKNNIPYKPNDRTKLKVSVDALLLGEYSNIALQIAIKPYHISKKVYEDRIQLKQDRANAAGIVIIFLNKEHIENLDDLLNRLKS